MALTLATIFPGSRCIACESGSGNEALRLLVSEPWDLFITEILLSQRDGLDVIRRMRRNRTIPALVVTALDERAYALLALRAGASGLIHKTAPPEVMKQAIERVAVGHRYFSEQVLDLLAGTFHSDQLPDPLMSLTDRERDIFLRVVSGESVASIALELCVARKTIYSHRANIQRKLGFRDQVDLTRYAFASGLVPCRRRLAGMSNTDIN